MAARRGRGQRDLAKERHWRRIVRHWRRSGFCVREFCDWQELSEPSFYAWRREIGKRDRESATAVSSNGAATAQGPQPNGSTRAPAPAFLPVHVVADGVRVEPVDPSREAGLEVHLPGGVRLSVPPACDRALLRDVIACCQRVQPESHPC